MTIHLPSLFYGALGAAVLYTFFPALAKAPSGWLRSAWGWLKGLWERLQKDVEKGQ